MTCGAPRASRRVPPPVASRRRGCRAVAPRAPSASPIVQAPEIETSPEICPCGIWHNLLAMRVARTQKTVVRRAEVTSRLSRSIVQAIDDSTILRVRAGGRSDHRFIGIWAVVVDGRVFARSWTQKAGGWYQTFLDDPFGTIQVGDRQVQIRAVRVGGTRIHDAIERVYANKYTTPASLKYVRGFRTRRRRETTMEFARR